MPIPAGLGDGKSSLAVPIRASLSVPDLTQVTAVSFDVLYPDQTTRVTLPATIPATIPPNVKGFESFAGNPNPTSSLLVAVRVFQSTDMPTQTGPYLVRVLLTVVGASAPVPCQGRPLQVTGPFGP